MVEEQTCALIHMGANVGKRLLIEHIVYNFHAHAASADIYPLSGWPLHSTLPTFYRWTTCTSNGRKMTCRILFICQADLDDLGIKMEVPKFFSHLASWRGSVRGM